MYIFFAGWHSVNSSSSGLELQKSLRLRVGVFGVADLFFESYKNLFAFYCVKYVLDCEIEFGFVILKFFCNLGHLYSPILFKAILSLFDFHPLPPICATPMYFQSHSLLVVFVSFSVSIHD